MAWFASTAGVADAEGEGLPVALVLELPTGSVVQAAATVKATIAISPRAVCLTLFIFDSLLIAAIFRLSNCLNRKLMIVFAPL